MRRETDKVDGDTSYQHFDDTSACLEQRVVPTAAVFKSRTTAK